MPTCAALGCSSRSERYSFKVFPKNDLRRRQIWIDRLNRPGWSPNRHSALCERHFDREQWEVPRQDGKRKLKETAVPTIFCVAHSDDAVSRDHSYSVAGYRQLYFDNSGFGEDDFPMIEHVKVEVDENENLSSEISEEEETESANGDTDLADEDGVENIQCTPDISVYPEKGEPDPIEMVECEENTLNNFMGDPGDDPLAISAEDEMKVTVDVPLFRDGQKFVFIHRDTKYVAPLDQLVQGEPVVRKPKRVHWTSLVQPPPTSMASSPLRQVSTSLPKLRVVSPESLGVKEPTKNFLPPKLHMVSASTPPKLKVISKKVKLMGSNDYSSSSEINIRDEPVKGSSTLGSFLGLSDSAKVEAKSYSESADKSAPSTIKFQETEKNLGPCKFQSSCLSEFNSRVLAKIVKKTTISVDLETPEQNLLPKNQELINKKCELFIKPVENRKGVEKHSEECPDARKPLWKPVSMDGIRVLTKDGNKKIQLSLKGKKVFRLTGNNNLKKWINKREPNGSCSKLSSQQLKIAQKFKMLKEIQSSSVVVLNPYDKSTTSGQFELEKTSSSSSLASKKKVRFYTCSTCHFSFMTLERLRIHLATHLNHNPSESKEDSGSDIEFIGEFSPKKDRKVSEAEKWGDNTDSSSRVLQKMVLKQINKRQTNKKTQQFENNIVYIPNLNNLKNTVKRPNKLSLSNYTGDTEIRNLLSPRISFLQRKKREVRKHKQKMREFAQKMHKNKRLQKKSSKTTENELLEENKGINDSSKRYSLREKRRISYKPLKSKRDFIEKPTNSPILLNILKTKLNTKLNNNTLLTKNPVVLLSRLNISPCGNRNTIDESYNTKETSSISSERVLKSTENDLTSNGNSYSLGENSSNSAVKGKGELLVEDGGNESLQMHELVKKELSRQNFKARSKKLKAETSSDNVIVKRQKVKCPCGLIVLKSELKNHASTFHSETITCKLCNKTFQARLQLREHMKNDHSKAKPYECSKKCCNQSFKTKRELQNHKRSHR